MLKRHWVLLTVLTLAAMLMLSACGSGVVETVLVTEIVGGEVQEVVVTATPEPTEAPAGQDTIIICMSQEPDSLYRINSNMSVSVMTLHPADLRGWYVDRGFFYESAALVNNEFPSFENGGAEIVGEGSDAVLTVTYQFKDNITWSDGEPFTVDDIIFTRDVLLDPETPAISRGIEDQKTYEKIDDYTLKVTYPPGILDPTYFLPPLSAVEGITGPLPEHVLGDVPPGEIATSEYARLPNPTLGPYQFVEWVEGDHITLEANENWWGGEVKTPNLIFRVIADTNQLLASTLSGECDFATNDGLQLPQLPFIQQSADQGLIAYDAVAALVWEHIDFNVTPPPEAESDALPFFADARVRQAIAFGTNRQEMTEQILYGEVQPLTSYLPAEHWAYNPEVADLYPYDPDQARELLAEAGWSDSDGDGVLEASETLSGEYTCGRGAWSIPAGTPFEVSFHTTTGNAMREQISQLFQADMADIGLMVNLDLLPASVWFASDGPLFARTYQVGEFAWVAQPDPTSVFTYLGQNVYKTPEGEFLVAGTILGQNPDVLAGTGLTEEDFYFGRPTEEDLPEGYTLSQPEQIPHEGDNYEGGNNLSWCDNEADQLIFDADNVIDPSDRLPFFLEHQMVFAEQVPSLPLFQRVNIDAYATNLCGVALGPANTQTWNVETWYFADSCE